MRPPWPGRRADLGVRPGESDPARMLGRVVLAALAAPIVVGALVIVYQAGVGIPVQVGVLVGLVVGLCLWRHVRGAR